MTRVSEEDLAKLREITQEATRIAEKLNTEEITQESTEFREHVRSLNEEDTDEPG